MAVTADRVVIELQAKLDQYRRELTRGDKEFADHMSNMRRQAGLTEAATVKSFGAVGRAGKAMANQLRGAASALALAAGAAAGIRVLADFAQNMATVKAITRATEVQFEALSAKAQELGATTRFTASQAAEGMLYLARAGFDTEQVLGSIEGTLRLAQAGNMDLGRAADIASNILQGFRLEVAETARVVDVLALAANSSNTDVSQLGEAMKYAAPVAAGLGVGIEDTAAAVSALSDAGLQASMAGTGLRRVMIGLEKQSKQGEKVLAKYGLTMEDISMSSTGSLADSLQRLADAGISTADAMTLFGLRGGPAFEVLQSSLPKVRAFAQANRDAAGTAEEMAKVMDDNLNGAIIRVQSRLEALIHALGEAGAEDNLLIALEGLEKLLILAAENADILSVAIVALTVRALLPLGAALGGRVIKQIVALRTQLVLLHATAGTSVTTLNMTAAAAGRVAMAFGPLSIAVAAAAAAYVIVARNAREGEEALKRARAQIDASNSALDRMGDVRAFLALRDGANLANPALKETKGWLQQILDDLRDIQSISIVQQAMDLQREIGAQERAYADLKVRQAGERARQMPDVSEYDSGAAQWGRDSEIQTKFDLDTTQAHEKLKELEKAAAELRDSVGDEIYTLASAGDVEGLKKFLTERSGEVANAGAIQRETKKLTELQDALSAAQSQGSDAATERLSEQIAIAEETIRLLSETSLDESTARDLARDLVNERKSGNDGSDLDKASVKALEEIRDAHRSLAETEREQINRLLQERLAAIDKAKLSQAEADEMRRQAYDVHAAQIADLSEAEIKAAEERDKLAEQAAAKEISLLDQLLNARDQMLGRTASLLEREYDLKKAQIEREIEDETRKHEALAALDDQYAARRADLENQALGKGEHSSSELERLQATQDKKLEMLEDWYAENLEREQEYLDRRKEINQETEDAITQMRQEASVAQLNAAEKGFDAAADLAKKFAGENKGIYKALFLAEKAAALASAYVQMNLAVAKAAAAAPPPANVPLITAAKVTGMATIAGIAASAIAGFKDGVINLKGPGTSRSDSIPAYLSRGESVMTAEATRRNAPLLEQMNRGMDVQAQLARIGQGAAINPTFIAGGHSSVQVAGSSIVFNGPVDDDTLPSLMALMDQRDRELESRIEQVIARDRLRTTPRHERNRFLSDR